MYFYDPIENFSTFRNKTIPIIRELSGGYDPTKVAFIVSFLELIEGSGFWASIISEGGKVFEDDGTVVCAQKIVKHFIERRQDALGLKKHDSADTRPPQNEENAYQECVGLWEPNLPLIGARNDEGGAEVAKDTRIHSFVQQQMMSADESKFQKEGPSEPERGMRDPTVPPPSIPGVLPTDSGYASARARSDTGKDVRGGTLLSAPRSGFESVLEEPPSLDSIPGAGIPEDATVYSTSSTVHPDDLDGYISAMTRELVDLIPFVTTQNPATMSRLVQSLPEILKAFSLMIGHCADSSSHREIMYFIYKHHRSVKTRRDAAIGCLKTDHFSCSEIVDQFTDHFVREESCHSSQAIPGMTLGEKMSYWHDKALVEAIPGMSFESETPPLNHVESISSDNSNGEPFLTHDLASNGEDNFGYGAAQEETWENEDEINTGQETGMLLKHREYLINSSAYDWLRNALEREILLEPAYPDIRGGIRRQVLDSLPPKRLSRVRGSQSYDVVFEMDWDPQVFLNEYGTDGGQAVSIGTAITVTSTSQDAQALTTSQYLSQTWPSIGKSVIQVIQGVFGVSGKREQQSEGPATHM